MPMSKYSVFVKGLGKETEAEVLKALIRNGL